MFPPGGAGCCAPGEGIRSHPPAAAEDAMDGATLQIVEQQEVGQISRSDQPPVHQSKAPRRRPAGGAINGGQRRAQRDGAAHQVVQVAFFADVQRIAVVGAEAEKGRGKFVDERSQRRQILRNRSLPDQHLHALGQLFPPLGQVCGLVTVTNATG